MEKIETIVERIVSTTYLDERNFLREQTTNPQIVFECLNELALHPYETLDHFYHITINVAYAYRLLNEPQLSIKYYEKVLQIFLENDPRLCAVLIQLAESYKFAGQHTKALKLLESAQHLQQQYDHQYLTGLLYQQTAKCYWELGNVNVAQQYAKKALVIQGDTKESAQYLWTEQVLME